MSESNFGALLRHKLYELGLETYRVESHATSPGIPDIHWIAQGGLSGWLELKEEAKWPFSIKYRPKQAHWLHIYGKRGGRACTVLHVRSDNCVYIIPSDQSLVAAIELNAATCHRVPLSLSTAWDTIASLIRLGLPRPSGS